MITVTLGGGKASTLYEFTVTVTGPDQISTATAQYKLTTDSNGSGKGTLNYPTDFTNGIASPRTNETGKYQIQVNQNLPYSTGVVASSAFSVTSVLLLNIVSPAAGTVYLKGSNASLNVIVSDINRNPYTLANVNASLPNAGGLITLQRGEAMASYSASYLIKWSDPTGMWSVDYLAIDSLGNRGEASVTVKITTGTIIVQRLTAVDTEGNPRSSFYNNELVGFQITASYPDGSQLSAAGASIQIVDPDGKLVVTLAAIYESSLNRLVSISGFQLNSSHKVGMWTAVIPSSGVDDGFANTGPSTPLLIQFAVMSTVVPSYPNSSPGINSSQLTLASAASLIPATLVGITALVPVVAFKRKESKKRDDDTEDIVKLAHEAGFALVEGRSQTGKSTTLYSAIGGHASHSEASLLLTFETPPEEVRSQMSQSGINAESLEERGLLRIVDCSNLSESIDLSFIRRKLVRALGKGSQSCAILIDSLNLLFDDLEEEEVEDLIAGLTTEALSRNGALYASITFNGFSKALMSNLEGKARLVLVTDGRTQNEAQNILLRIKKQPTDGGSLVKKQLKVRGKSQASQSVISEDDGFS